MLYLGPSLYYMTDELFFFGTAAPPQVLPMTPTSIGLFLWTATVTLQTERERPTAVKDV